MRLQIRCQPELQVSEGLTELEDMHLRQLTHTSGELEPHAGKRFQFLLEAGSSTWTSAQMA